MSHKFHGGSYLTWGGIGEHAFVDVEVGAVYGHIFFLKGSTWHDIPYNELKDNDGSYPKEDDWSAKLRAAHNWAIAHGYVGAYPNGQRGVNDIRGHICLSGEVAEWRDVPYNELKDNDGSHPDINDIPGRFRAAFNWANQHGYIGGFPNGQRGANDIRGHIFFKSGAAKWTDIPYEDLKDNNGKHPSDADIAARLRAAHNWSDRQGYVGTLPNFNQARYGDNRMHFDCYGGHSGEELQWREEGWGDLHGAVWVCCGDPADYRNDYNRKNGGWYGENHNIVGGAKVGDGGDCCGIYYGINGVCQQMANRILYTCAGEPIMKPKGWEFTFLVYGPYGHTDDDDAPQWAQWDFPEPFLTNMGIKLDKDVNMIDKNSCSYKFLQILSQKSNGVDVRKEATKFFVRTKLGEDLPEDQQNAIQETIDDFLVWKRTEDDKYIKDELTSDDYASDTNSHFGKALQDIYNKIGPENYEKLFGTTATSYDLIDPEVIKKS